MGDLGIIIKTVLKAFVKREGINREGTASDLDFGDYLLKKGEVSKDTYLKKQKMAAEILDGTYPVREERDFEDDLVSIIMPSYNSEDYISATIQSVQAQTYQKWELLIVDDCSLDRTVPIIKQMNDHRIRLFINDKNSGAALSRNRALREAKGRWIAFLDSDDLWVPQKLERQLQFMKNQGYAFTFTDYRIQLNGRWLPYIMTAPNIVTRRKMYDYCYFSTITVMYDQTKIGLIQVEDLRKNNDYAMWLKAVERVNCYRFPECLSYYIKHEGSVSSGKKIKLVQWHYILFRKGLHKTRVMSCILTMNNLFHGMIKKIRYLQKISEVGKKTGAQRKGRE